jgi:hypothetical protein
MCQSFIYTSLISFRLLAAYDLGAPPKILQAIYNKDVKSRRPIDIVEKKELEPVTVQNWINFLGKEKSAPFLSVFAMRLTCPMISYYSSFVEFFTSEILANGTGETLEKYVFSIAANGNDTNMLLRFVGGACVPFSRLLLMDVLH